jgi:hypothetical protein
MTGTNEVNKGFRAGLAIELEQHKRGCGVARNDA